MDGVVELVGGGFVIKVATPSSLLFFQTPHNSFLIINMFYIFGFFYNLFIK